MGDADEGAAHVFVSYAHEDEDWKDRIRAHLAALRRTGRISIWHDRELGGGDDWRDEIRAELDAADIILLLVSSDFIASDFIWEEELRVAMDRRTAGEARVVPVIVRPCDWNDLEFAQLQALPRDGQPISEHDDTDRALTEVAEGVERIVDRIAEEARS